MLDNVWFSTKHFPTGFTLEWFFTCVHTKKREMYYIIIRNLLIIRCWSPHMSDQIRFLSKWFPTIFTLKRFFSCVHSGKKVMLYVNVLMLRRFDHLICWTRFSFLLNIFPQVSHLKDFSARHFLRRKRIYYPHFS